MSTMVQGPDGRVWTVDRNVWPWRTPQELLASSRRSGRGDADDGAADAFRVLDVGVDSLSLLDDGLVGVVVAVVLVLVVATGGTILWGMAAVVLALWAVAIAGAVTLWRLLARRPWTVTAASSSGDLMRWQVTGWRASRSRVDEVARALRLGDPPPLDDPPLAWPPNA